MSNEAAGRVRSKLPRWARSTLMLFGRLYPSAPKKNERHESAQARTIVLAQQLLQHVTEPVVACGFNGRILVSNPAANELFSSEGRSLVGQLIPPAMAASIKSELRVGECGAVLARAGHPLSDRLLKAKGPSDRFTFVPVQLGNLGEAVEDVTFFVGHALNRKAEIRADPLDPEAKSKSELANEVKSFYLATVCHEIRTPLNGLFGMLDLLSKTELVDDQRELLATAKVSARQLRVLLDDVLDMSKIEAGKLELESVPFDVQEKLGSAVKVFSATAEGKGLTLGFKHRLPQRILMGDVSRITQVLNNLIDNALKFTQSGFVAVDARTEQPDPDQALCKLWVTVQDSGRGVSPDQVHHLFHPFVQADGSVRRNFGGTGLGLALCRQLCQAMGGQISATARPGGGMIFTFMVRCELAYGMSPFVDTRPLETSLFTALHGASVLVVDDTRVNQTLLSRWVTTAGMTVTQVFDGKTAVATVRSQSFDIILMDISMPEMSGIDATRTIRALASSQGGNARRFSTTPILGMSGYAMSEDRKAGLAVGMSGYVSKPLKHAELLDLMVQALSRD